MRIDKMRQQIKKWAYMQLVRPGLGNRVMNVGDM